MYKLTYETDDDLDERSITKTDAFSKKTEKETVIYDKSENTNPPSWSTMATDQRTSHVELDGRKDASSGTRATYSGRHAKADSKPKNDNKKFYSMFTNSPSSSTSKKSESHSCKGFQAFLLVFYLLVLTAAVIILFIFLKKFKDENDVLKEQVSLLRRANFAGEAIALQQFQFRQEPRHVPPPHSSGQFRKSPDIGGCCDTSWKSVRDFRIKLARTSDQLGVLQAVTKKNFGYLMELERNLTTLAKQVEAFKITNEELQINNRFANEESFSTESVTSPTLNKSTQESRKETAAFCAIRALAENVLGDVNNFDETLALSRSINSQNTVIFDDELVDQGQDMDTKTGTFTAPLDGVYAFFLSFCSEISTSENVEMTLMKNTQPARIFQVPIASENSTAFAITYASPPLSLTPTDSSTQTETGSLMQHRYSVIIELEENDEVKLQLTRGAIVELASRDGFESQHCTEFSGYRIS